MYIIDVRNKIIIAFCEATACFASSMQHNVNRQSFVRSGAPCLIHVNFCQQTSYHEVHGVSELPCISNSP